MRAPRLLPVLALAGFAAALAAGAAAAVEKGVYTLTRDGQAHRVATLTTKEGADFLSLADLAKAVGGAFVVDAQARQARIDLGAKNVVVVEVGSNVAQVNGVERAFSQPTLVAPSGIYVPPDFVTEVLATALKKAVNWKDAAASLLDPRAAAADLPPGTIRAEIDVRSQKDYTRVLYRFPGTSVLPYTVNAPAGRIVLRIQADNLTADPELLVGDGAVERLVFDKVAGRGTLSIELGSEYRDHQAAVLRDPFRVIIDVYRKSPYTGPPEHVVRKAPAPLPVPAKEPAAGEAKGQTDTGLRPPGGAPDLLAGPLADGAAGPPGAGPGAGNAGRSRGDLRTIVIDPGHGGSEPGAKGPTNLLEKDLTLDLAKRLAQTLQKSLGVTVILTRSADGDLSLDDRTGIANHEKADLFLSIHANASLRKNARGAETYFLSRNATDDESRKLAALENQVGEAKGFEGTDLELILWSLAQNQYLKESQALAEVIQKEMDVLLEAKDRGVKQAPFKVLVGATMPAVLVEVGFITNPAEEKLLKDEGYKNKIATALYKSILAFKQTRETKMGALRSDGAAARP